MNDAISITLVINLLNYRLIYPLIARKKPYLLRICYLAACLFSNVLEECYDIRDTTSKNFVILPNFSKDHKGFLLK